MIIEKEVIFDTLPTRDPFQNVGMMTGAFLRFSNSASSLGTLLHLARATSAGMFGSVRLNLS